MQSAPDQTYKHCFNGTFKLSLHVMYPEFGGLIMNVTPATTLFDIPSMIETLSESRFVTYIAFVFGLNIIDSGSSSTGISFILVLFSP